MGLPDRQVFREDFEEFIRFLASNQTLRVISRDGNLDVKIPGLVILLGDFVDLWDGDLSKLEAFLAQYARSLTENTTVFYLRGNHDYMIQDVNRAPFGHMSSFEISDYKVLRIAGRSWFFIHGHQFMSAFGHISLAFESLINPYYSIIEWFLSRVSGGRGKQLTTVLTVVTVLLGFLLAFEPEQIGLVLRQANLYVWFWWIFGLLFGLGFVTAWRLFQKSVWKFLSMIFGETFDSIRGATRGDTIEYLTKASKPISRWFKESKLAKEARGSGLVCFGHTHIPEGPQHGKDEGLKDIVFLNTGSWVKPPLQRLRRSAEIARKITRPYDGLDQYVYALSVLIVGISLTFPQWVSVYAAMALFTVSSLIEIFVVLGKSSYRRIEKTQVRSLAFIGKEIKSDPPAVLLYWDPRTEVLSTFPPDTESNLLG